MGGQDKQSTKETVGQPLHEFAKFQLQAVRNQLRYRNEETTFGQGYYFAQEDITEGRIEAARTFVSESRDDILNGYGDPYDKLVDMAKLAILEGRIGMTEQAQTDFQTGLKRLQQMKNNLQISDAISWFSICGGKLGLESELIRLASDSQDDSLRQTIYCETGKQLVVENKIGKAVDIFHSSIGPGYQKAELGRIIAQELYDQGDIDGAKTMIRECESVVIENDVGVDTRQLFDLYLLTGQLDKVESILTQFNSKFELHDNVFTSDMCYTTQNHIEALFKCQQTEKIIAILDQLNTNVNASDASQPFDEFGNNFYVTRVQETIVNAYYQLGLIEKAKSLSEQYNVELSIATISESAVAASKNGQRDISILLAKEAMELLTSSGRLIHNSDFGAFFNAANILFNENEVEYVLSHFAMTNRLVYGYDVPHFYRQLSRFSRARFADGQDLDFSVLKDYFVVAGETNWEMVIQSAFAVNQKNLNIMASLLPVQDQERATTLVQLTSLQYSTDYAKANKPSIFGRIRTLLISELDKDTKTGSSDRDKIKTFMDILIRIGDKETKDLLLNLTQGQYDITPDGQSNNINLRLIKTLAELNTNRGNDFLLSMLGDQRLNYHESLYLLKKLVANKYVPSDVMGWLASQDLKRKELKIHDSTKHAIVDVQIIKHLIGQMRLNPSREILDMISGEVADIEPSVRLDQVTQRLIKIAESRNDVESADSAEDLINKLSQDREKAMYYYLLNNGNTRFDLINNYTFDKFWDILTLTHSLKVHRSPIDEFDKALTKANFTPEERTQIIHNLELGHHPFYTTDTPRLEKTIRLDVTNNSKYEGAVKEVGGVFGKDQIGLCLKSSFYRRYLQQVGNKDLLSELDRSANLPGRLAIINRIEADFPDFLPRIVGEIGPSWANLDTKLSFGGVALVDILTKDTNPVNAEAIITKIEEKRAELKNARKNIILALSSENPKVKAINSEISRKKKSIIELEKGIGVKPQLVDKIETIRSEITKLEAKVNNIGLDPLSLRYQNLTSKERKIMVTEETQNLQLLSEKDPSMVLLYLITELAGQSDLSENDVSVIKETGSHLKGPMQMIIDLAKLDSVNSNQRVEKPVRIRMLDKKQDLSTMVRFADSKICCFSSSNYTMRVAHNIENKQWVASINKDPLSFVFEIEDDTLGHSSNTTSDLGFIFGMYGVNEEGEAEIMLNGVYYSGGNDINTTVNILDAIEELLSAKIRARDQLVASMYGGQIQGDIPGYSNDGLVATRLRAIDDGNGSPTTIIYDDLGTVINKPVEFSDKVWHKKLKSK